MGSGPASLLPSCVTLGLSPSLPHLPTHPISFHYCKMKTLDQVSPNHSGHSLCSNYRLQPQCREGARQRSEDAGREIMSRMGPVALSWASGLAPRQQREMMSRASSGIRQT